MINNASNYYNSLLSQYNNTITGAQTNVANQNQQSNFSSHAGQTVSSGVDVQISDEAKAAMKKVEDMFKNINTLQNYLDNDNKFKPANQERVNAITSELDVIFGTNVASTSDVAIKLDTENRQELASVFSELKELFEKYDDFSAMSDEDKAKVEELTAKADQILLKGDVRPSHSLSSLPMDKLMATTGEFVKLLDILNSSNAIKNGLSEAEVILAADIGKNIDGVMNEHATKLPEKELTDADRKRADELIQELSVIMEDEQQQDVAQMLRDWQSKRVDLWAAVFGESTSNSNSSSNTNNAQNTNLVSLLS